MVLLEVFLVLLKLTKADWQMMTSVLKTDVFIHNVTLKNLYWVFFFDFWQPMFQSSRKVPELVQDGYKDFST